MKTIFKRLLLIIVGIIGSILILELSLDMMSFYVEKINKGRYQKKVKPHKIIILCIGDSVTYGVGDRENKGYPARQCANLS